MTEQSPNAQFHASSFLQGANADYVDALAARHAEDPGSVDAQWAEFFRALGDDPRDARRAGTKTPSAAAPTSTSTAAASVAASPGRTP